MVRVSGTSSGTMTVRFSQVYCVWHGAAQQALQVAPQSEPELPRPRPRKNPASLVLASSASANTATAKSLNQLFMWNPPTTGEYVRPRVMARPGRSGYCANGHG